MTTQHCRTVALALCVQEMSTHTHTHLHSERESLYGNKPVSQSQYKVQATFLLRQLVEDGFGIYW